MAKINVEKWFEYEESSKLEMQVKYYIASTVESYLNGCYDAGYEAMTIEGWTEYVWNCLQYDKDAMVNGKEFKHLNFLGKENIVKLTKSFITNYEDAKAYTI